MNVLLFPGQGAQYRGMGKEVWANYPQLADAASQILGFSIIELCLNDPKDQLRLTQHTQPALYVANALHYYRWQETASTPEAVAGHSLGEYLALLVAGCIDFETGLRLVQKRGQLMSQASGGTTADHKTATGILATLNGSVGRAAVKAGVSRLALGSLRGLHQAGHDDRVQVTQ